MVIPFAPSLEWVREYLDSIADGEAPAAAAAEASERCGYRGKDFARTHISAAAGVSMLGVPVEGGASVLKRRDADPLISSHGKWRSEHLGAWNAAYGRMPYYQHLIPELEDAYADALTLSLEEFNKRILQIAMDWIDYGDARKHKGRLNLKISEISIKVDPKLSIFDAIFRFGKETVFALI